MQHSTSSDEAYDTPDSVVMMSKFLDCITVDFKGSGKQEFVRQYIGIPSADPIFQTLKEIRHSFIQKLQTL